MEGGYLVTGRWAFGSGVGHSDWISRRGLGGGRQEQRTRRNGVVFPTSDACIHDNWQVMGLKGHRQLRLLGFRAFRTPAVHLGRG